MNIETYQSAYIVIGLFILTIVGLIKFQSRPEAVFGTLLLVLFSSGFVTNEQVVKSFANQGILTLVLLMVCSLALEKTKLLRLVANFVIKPSYRASWLNLFVFSSLSSAVLNNTAVVSAMLAPIRSNTHHSASKLLIPLSYSAILGGTLTLVGTSTNLIVNSMVVEAGMPALNFFDFTLIGSLLVLGCGITLFVFSKYLPDRPQQVKVIDDYFIDTKVVEGSALIGRSIEENGLRNLDSLFLVQLQRGKQLISPVVPSEIIQVGDRLLFSGDIKKVTLLNHFSGLESFANQNGLPLDNLSEVIVRPDSSLVGKTLKRVGFRALFDAAVVAIKRDGENISGKLGEVVLKPGDNLVLAVGEDFKSRHNINKNFFFVSGVETERTLNRWKEWLAVTGFLLAIFLSAIEAVSLFKGLLLFLGVLLLSGTLKPNEILHRLPVQIWLIISSAILLSYALNNTDATDLIDMVIKKYQTFFTPFIGLCVVYILTWWLTELVTNNAAAALMFPVAMGLATSLGVEPISYVMAVAFGASASFISPYGYQTNLMVYNAGQYQLTDFLKVGLPISIVFGVITVFGLAILYGV
ncbi:SLC13 family permease [Vibrio sp. B1FLJ16]|uniref:SLC13 family permease n=1 Tax=Vibrio sp. B1FLJ16 TaxID=2751178 RepID=UPI0015F49ECA|nr:SLC13 family permease [Vibrio sp. B1FLJ16]CAD7803580.1 COG0471 Di- and tricarboxylate transporters [Vibrio sp. B1FLJ16]CAE6896233.1 COG0471 Di- and tricarboxylate transporters [Vibrio sp. B1FLJ16]